MLIKIAEATREAGAKVIAAEGEQKVKSADFTCCFTTIY